MVKWSLGFEPRDGRSDRSSIRLWSMVVVRPRQLNHSAAVEGGHDPGRACLDQAASSCCWIRPATVFIAQGIEGQCQQPVGKAHAGHLLATPAGDAIVEPTQIRIAQAGPGGSLDEDPPEPPRALLGDVTSPRVLVGGVL